MPIEIYPHGVPRDKRVTKPRLKWRLVVTGASGKQVFKRDFVKKKNAEKFSRVIYNQAHQKGTYVHAEITRISAKKKIRSSVSSATKHILSG